MQLIQCNGKNSRESSTASNYDEVATFARITFSHHQAKSKPHHNITFATLHYSVIFLAERWNHIPYNPGWALPSLGDSSTSTELHFNFISLDLANNRVHDLKIKKTKKPLSSWPAICELMYLCLHTPLPPDTSVECLGSRCLEVIYATVTRSSRSSHQALKRSSTPHPQEIINSSQSL